MVAPFLLLVPALHCSCFPIIPRCRCAPNLPLSLSAVPSLPLPHYPLSYFYPPAVIVVSSQSSSSSFHLRSTPRAVARGAGVAFVVVVRLPHLRGRLEDTLQAVGCRARGGCIVAVVVMWYWCWCQRIRCSSLLVLVVTNNHHPSTLRAGARSHGGWVAFCHLSGPLSESSLARSTVIHPASSSSQGWTRRQVLYHPSLAEGLHWVVFTMLRQ